MTNGINSEHLRSFVERIERRKSDKRDIAEDIKEIYAEAKSTGFDPKVIRHIIKMRREDKAKRDEFEEILSLYLDALGELADTPLGAAAVHREFGGAH